MSTLCDKCSHNPICANKKDFEHIIERIDNVYLIMSTSVGGYDDKWELAVISKYAETDSRWPVFEYGENNYYIDYETPITNDVIGYLTDEEVRNTLDRIYKLSKR